MRKYRLHLARMWELGRVEEMEEEEDEEEEEEEEDEEEKSFELMGWSVTRDSFYDQEDAILV